MKQTMLYYALVFQALLLLAATGAPRKSLLNNDPNVVYLSEHTDSPVFLTTTRSTPVYSTKKGTHKLGTYPANTKLQLLAIGGENAYRVKGKAKHSTVSGWVSPKLLTSSEKDFRTKLQSFYERTLIVRDLIANNDVAIGMTLDEVRESLGEPTKTEVKQTRKGDSGKWEYIVAIEEKHYRTVIDPRSGQTYRQLSHITTEEKERTTLEFEDNVVTSVTRKKNNGPGQVRIIPVPLIFGW
jgi:outer membrane protein assembly factor BamE (lipoprotein component of BamABCDE complex)